MSWVGCNQGLRVTTFVLDWISVYREVGCGTWPPWQHQRNCIIFLPRATTSSPLPSSSFCGGRPCRRGKGMAMHQPPARCLWRTVSGAFFKRENGMVGWSWMRSFGRRGNQSKRWVHPALPDGNNKLATKLKLHFWSDEGEDYVVFLSLHRTTMVWMYYFWAY